MRFDFIHHAFNQQNFAKMMINSNDEKDILSIVAFIRCFFWSGRDFSFQQAYEINAIPRFILIDPDGNILDANAPRPSDPSLKIMLDSFNLQSK